MNIKNRFIWTLFLFSLPLVLFATKRVYTISSQDTSWADRLNSLIIEHYKKKIEKDTLVVCFLEGRYYVSKPVLFNGSDKYNKPVIIQGLGDVVFTGGIILDNKRLLPMPKEMRNIIYSKDAVDKIKVYQLNEDEGGCLGDLSCVGFSRPIQPVPSMLFLNGERMTLARYPNTGSVDEIRQRKTVIPINKVIDPGMNQVKIPGESFPGKNRNGIFECRDRRMEIWEKADDIWVDGIFARDWAWSLNKVKNIDSNNHSITLEYPEKYDLRSGSSYFFFVCNLLEELDASGEYYIDRNKRIVYCYLPDNLDRCRLELSIVPFTFFQLNNAGNVSFRNLRFELGRDGAVDLKNCRNVNIENCFFHNLGTTAVAVDGYDNKVSNCVISSIGGTAVSLEGGDFKTLSPGGNSVQNCQISDWSFYYRVYNSAVGLKGVGNRIEDSHLSNSPHGAITISGNNHIIKDNEIDNVCLEFKDFGAIYAFTGANQEMRGNSVVDNYFHDIGLNSDGVYAVYIDECSAGWTVSGNVFYKIGSKDGFVSAIFTNTGYDLKIDNNVFIDCSNTFVISYHLTTWGKERYERYFKPNWDEKVMNPSNISSVYLENYPSLKNFAGSDKFWPHSCSFTNNAIYNKNIPLKHKGKFFVTRSSDVLRSDSLVYSKGNTWISDLK